MKKLIFTISIAFAALVTNAQFTWTENFDAPSLGDSVGTGTNNPGNTGFQIDSRLFVSAANSDSAWIGQGDTVMLITNKINFTNMNFVLLSFDQICKIHFFDKAELYYSLDSLNWIQITDAEYKGPAPFGLQLNSFSSASYGDWFPGFPDSIPTNSWWHHEPFDLSGVVGNFPAAWIRWMLHDPGNDSNIPQNGWHIDNIEIQAAPCELYPPLAGQFQPIYQGVSYSLGPFDLNAWAVDQSGILNAWLIYTINGGTPDTVNMVNNVDSTFTGQIPVVNDGDSVCYYFVFMDGSGCDNIVTLPQHCFIASAGISFPYCDNFDGGVLWSDTTNSGSSWQLGTPAFGATTGAHSPPNAWDIDLASGYQLNTVCYLYSPVFNFPQSANARLTFWQNRETEEQSDGVILQYSLDAGLTWTRLGDLQTTNACGCETNWYTNQNFNNNQLQWDGNSNGWVKSDFIFPDNTYSSPTFMLRFRFNSDGFGTQSGFSIDDLCFTLPTPDDPGIANIVSPSGNGPAGSCVPVTVTIHNYGSNPLDSTNVYYTYNGVTNGPFLWSGPTLAPGAETQFTMPCDTLLPGSNDLCAWVSLGADVNHTNDTSCTSIFGIQTVVLDSVSPFCDFFDGASTYFYNELLTGGNAGSNWQWGTPAFGTTNSAHTPPNAWDINLTSAYANSANVALYTPFFDITNAFNPYLSFYVNYNTEQNWDGVRMEYSTGNGIWTLVNPPAGTTNWYNMQSIQCSQQPAWAGNSANVLQGTVNGWAHVQADDLTSLNLTGQQFVQFRFVFCSDPSVTVDGFSIDDFCFAMPAPYDAGIPQITDPVGSNPSGICDSVTVTIKNYGFNQLTSFNVYYSVDSIPFGNPTVYGPFLWTGILAAGATTSWTFPTCYTVPAGQYNLCSWTELLTPQVDGNFFNDTSCSNVFGIQTVTIDSVNPFCDNFDGALTYFYNELLTGGNAGSTWQLGTPAFGATNSAHTTPNAWDINLTTAYTNNANVALYTPYYDITNAFNPYLSFYVNFNSEQNWDGVRLEYSTGGGIWTLVDPPTGTTNWYNMQSIQCSQQPAWAGNSGTELQNTVNGWGHVQADDLTSLNLTGQQFVQFRFIFCSDGSVTVDGFSIDDFCFAMPAPYDAGIPQITQPGFSSAAGNCDSVTVVIKNFGYNPLTDVNVYYSIDSIPLGNPVTYGPFLWTGNLAAGLTTTWTLPTCFIVPSGGYNICSWTQLVNPQVDGNFFNDTSCSNSVGVPKIPLSYTNSFCDDFENGNKGWSVETIQAGTQWQLGTPAFGLTSGAHSPDTCWDVNLSTAPQANANTYLYSPIFDFTSAVNTVLDFYINFNTGLNQDGVKLEYNKNSQGWAQLFSTGVTTNWYNSTACNQAGWSGNSATVLQGTVNGWAHVIDSDLTTFNGPNLVQFRYKYCSGTFTGFPNDGFSLDDFCLTVPVPLTVAPVTINNNSNPPFIFPGQPITFNSDIKNKGTTPITSAVARLEIDAVLIATDTITYATPLNYNQFLNHVFSQTWTTAPGVHSVCAITSYPNQGVDLNPTDDTICSSISVIDTVSVTSGSYCPDFDTAPQWVTLNSYNFGPNTSWVLGTPNKGFMAGANTGTKAWVLGGLTTNYPNRDSSALFTPAFNIQTNRTYKLSFWHEYQMEFYQDGGNVEYSTDFGATWNVMGTGGFTNWYDSWFITSLGGTPPQPGWSLSSPVWVNPYWTICFNPQNGQTAYPVMFRFRFASDATVNDLGWAIDDFCFEDLGPCPLSVQELTSESGLALGQNYPNPTNGMTSIDYLIPSKGKVVLEIVNLLGQNIDTPVNETQAPGIHTVNFNASKLSAGIYYYSLTFNKEKVVKKMVITK